MSLNKNIIDTHTHLYLSKKPLKLLLENARKSSISKIINIGISIETSLQTLEIYKEYPFCFPTIGIHPCEAKNHQDLTKMKDLLKQHPFIAIGETGLDYYWDTTDPDIQKKFFIAQLEIAKTNKLPIIIHNRQADSDMLSIIKNYQSIPKVFHCYSSDPAFATETLNQNTYYSFTGMITYAKKGKVMNTIKELPLENILLETDTPYLTPKKFKGKDNEPAFIIEIAKKIAEIKKISLDKVIHQTTQNSLHFFKLLDA